MPKPVLAVDFDDVINDFNRAFLRHNQVTHGVLLQYEDLHSYEYTEAYGICEEEAHHRIWHFCHNLHHKVKPIAGVVEALKLLKELYEIHMVTSRCESIAAISHKWIDEWIPDIFANTHFTNGFTTKHPERRRLKVDVCREIGAVAHVDDSLSHVGSIAAQLGIPVFMLTQPWNKHETPPGVTRVESFNEVLEQLVQMAA
jgi:uncharacterized HAD superfamily protein